MSADLFAEFNDLSSPPPQQQQQQRRRQGSGSAFQDPFSSLQPAQAAPSQPTQQPWGTFQGQVSGSAGSWGSPPGNTAAPVSSNDDDDTWGDFEVAEPSAAQPTTVSQPTFSQPAASDSDPWEELSRAGSKPASNPPPTRLMRASTLDIMSNNLVDTSGFSGTAPHPVIEEARTPPPVQARFKEPSNPNIMFDAQEFELEGGEADETDEDEDDFGAFETGAPVSRPAPSATTHIPTQTHIHTQYPPPPSMDLLSLDDTLPPEPPKYQAAEPSPNPGFGATASTGAHPEPKTISRTTASRKPTQPTKSAVQEDDEWEAWDDLGSSSSQTQKSAVKPAPKKKPTQKQTPKNIPKKAPEPEPADSWDWGTADTTEPSKPEPRDDEPPPINVPPPSVLLSAFPGLFHSGSTLLFKPVAGQSTSIKQRILTDPKAVEFLQGYVLIATTAARVIAGRKHRWHRDKILAKSMSISAAGSKGMKLAGVDKTQSAREDREAADVAAAWREHVGPLRSAVAAAKSSGKASLHVPEISENLQVHTAKFVPTAPKPCVICGLKRDERVAKVDFEVEDSFGEWWVDHWGHRACKNFWREHEQALRQR